MFANVQAVIVDLDGTMLNTAPDFHAAINRMRAGFALPPLPIEDIIRFIGKGTENLIRCSLESDFSPSELEERFPAALKSYMGHYRDIDDRFAVLYPGVIEGLDTFKAKGLRLACVTNKPLAFALISLEKAGLHSYFEVIYGGDSLPRKKPHPAQMQQVCRDFGLPPAQVVAIGDSSNDAEAARAAGCFVLNVPYGYNHGLPIQDVDSDGIVPTLLDAANLIR
ncbi:MAG TPA: phosphoglycolate phosphatase [Herbaspirillum sp.]|jgi:phosphoglycolate phosphatase